MRTVLDASAAMHIVMRTGRAAEFIAQLEASHLVLAPTLFHGEVANTLWKYVGAGHIDKATALARLEEASSLVEVFEPDERLAAEALSLAIARQHSVYDLLYVVTAMRHGACLVSADTRLLQLAAGIDPGMA